MAKYNSINDVIVGHLNVLIEDNNLDPKDYPYQNDVNSAVNQLAKVYAAISNKTVDVPQDEFSITGALDCLLTVVDSIIGD